MINNWNQCDMDKKEFNESLDEDEPAFSFEIPFIIKSEFRMCKTRRVYQIEGMIERIIDRIEANNEESYTKLSEKDLNLEIQN